MYRYSYLPVVQFEELQKAVKERFKKVITEEEIFWEDVEEGIYSYPLDAPLAVLPPERAINYHFIKTSLEKDFNLFTKEVLIEVYYEV